MELWQMVVSICAGAVTLLTLLDKLGVLKSKLNAPTERVNERLDKYDELLSVIVKRLDDSDKRFKGVDASAIRFEIMMLINNYPDHESDVLKLYDKYKDRGYNSYVSEIVRDYIISRRGERVEHGKNLASWNADRIIEDLRSRSVS